MSLIKFIFKKGGKIFRRGNRKKLELEPTRSTKTTATGWDIVEESMRAILPRRNKTLGSAYQCLDVENKNICNKMESSIHQTGEGDWKDWKREDDGNDREILTAIESSDFLVASYNGDLSKVELAITRRRS